MKKRMIAFLCIALFLLTACSREQAASVAPVPGATNTVDVADVSGDVVSLKDEQELDALSQSLEEDLGLEEIDEMVNLEI